MSIGRGGADESGFENGKIFVGGLPQETTKDKLKDHFATWGKIVDAVVMYDVYTKRSRGFGFVTYDSPEAVERVIKSSPHVIDGKEVECKRAQGRPQGNQGQTSSSGGSQQLGGSNGAFRTEKIFVGGLPDLTQDEFKAYFESFGRVVDAVLMFDKHSNRPRGFGFVTFESPDVVDEVLRNFHDHYLKGKWVEVKRAQPRDATPRPSRNGPASGAFGNYGGGYGGYEGEPFPMPGVYDAYQGGGYGPGPGHLQPPPPRGPYPNAYDSFNSYGSLPPPFVRSPSPYDQSYTPHGVPPSSSGPSYHHSPQGYPGYHQSGGSPPGRDVQGQVGNMVFGSGHGVPSGMTGSGSLPGSMGLTAGQYHPYSQSPAGSNLLPQGGPQSEAAGHHQPGNTAYGSYAGYAPSRYQPRGPTNGAPHRGVRTVPY